MKIPVDYDELKIGDEIILCSKSNDYSLSVVGLKVKDLPEVVINNHRAYVNRKDIECIYREAEEFGVDTLKPNMIVELRNKIRMVVMTGRCNLDTNGKHNIYLCGLEACNSADDYNEDLTSNSCSAFDIMIVYKYYADNFLLMLSDEACRKEKIIYKREE